MTTAAILLCALVLSACVPIPDDGAVHLRGIINPAMADRVERAVANGQRRFTIDSPGGYVIAAARIAKTLALAGNASVTAHGQCRSACALVLVAAHEKRATPGTTISLHDSSVHPIYAMVLEGFGVPPDMIAAHAGSINDRPLTAPEIARMGVTVIQ